MCERWVREEGEGFGEERGGDIGDHFKELYIMLQNN